MWAWQLRCPARTALLPYWPSSWEWDPTNQQPFLAQLGLGLLVGGLAVLATSFITAIEFPRFLLLMFSPSLLHHLGESYRGKLQPKFDVLMGSPSPFLLDSFLKFVS